MSEKEIKDRYLKEHDELTAAYIARRDSPEGITIQEKAAFEAAHTANWQACDAELRAGGYLPPGLKPPPPDYKALYSQASTDKDKLGVIAKSLGFE